MLSPAAIESGLMKVLRDIMQSCTEAKSAQDYSELLPALLEKLVYFANIILQK